MSSAQRPLVLVNDGAASSSGRGAGGLSRAAPRTVAGARHEHRCDIDTFRLNAPRRGGGARTSQATPRARGAPARPPRGALACPRCTHRRLARPGTRTGMSVGVRPRLPRALALSTSFSCTAATRPAREKLTRTGPTAPARVPAGSPASDDADPTRTPPTHALHRKQAPRGREQRRETRGRGDRPGLGGPMRIDRIRRGAGRPRGGGFTNAFRDVAAPLRRAARRARRARLAVARARVRGEYRGRRRQGEGARGVERRGGGGGGGGGGVGGAGARRRRRRRRRRVGVRRVLPPREEDVAQAEEEAGQENGRRAG